MRRHTDKLLFTPGPLTTSASVKAAMQVDLGSRDAAFVRLVREIREELVTLARATTDAYTAILMQGSGTFGVEAVLASTIPSDGKLLVLANGAYGQRIGQLAKTLKVATEIVTVPENEAIPASLAAARLAKDPAITHVAVVHCETTTGIFNPVVEIGAEVGRAGRTFIVDAMSSFGGVPLDMPAAGIDYLVSSANKCIEGVPGFSFIVARRETLARTEGWARSVSFDLLAQLKGLESNGQFRFTPPTHALLAFRQALRELADEGGVAGRAARYQTNAKTLLEGMRALGFQTYLPPDDLGYIITSFRYPTHPKWGFEDFYTRLSDKGFVIYPGKVTSADCFRVGNIGRLYPSDISDLLVAIEQVLAETGVTLQ